MAMIHVYPYLDSLEAIEGTCYQRRFWSDCADAQADLSLRWLHKPYCRFCDHDLNIAHNETYNKTCVTSKYSDQPEYPSSKATIHVYPYLDSLEAVEGTCDQRRLWSDSADAQTNLSIRWSYKSYCRFCRALAQVLLYAILNCTWINTLLRSFSYTNIKCKCSKQLSNTCM